MLAYAKLIEKYYICLKDIQDMKKYLLLAFAINALTLIFPLRGNCQDTGDQYAVIKYSVNYMRIQPDYETAVETQELMGVPVRILEADRYWRLIESPQPYKAWCTDKGLAMMSREEVINYIAAPKYIVTEPWGRVFSQPSLKSQPICDIVMGDLMRIPEKPSAKRGFRKVLLPDGTEGWVKKGYIEDFRHWAENRKPDFEHISRTALNFVGSPYLWGGMSTKGFDCSGLVRYSYMMNGILLPRNASQMCHCGIQIPIDPSLPMSERISELQAGDLVFFGIPATESQRERVTHVGIYLGDGMMIHSSHEVRINSLLPNREDSYENAWKMIRACRILGSEAASSTYLNNPAYFLQND